MHGMVAAPDITIMASEGAPGLTVTVGDNVNLSLSGTESDRLTGYFTALSAEGKITLPLDQHWLVNISTA